MVFEWDCTCHLSGLNVQIGCDNFFRADIRIPDVYAHAMKRALHNGNSVLWAGYWPTFATYVSQAAENSEYDVKAVRYGV